MTYDLRGKFWITPDGVIDVSADEHARAALSAMVMVAPGLIDLKRIFKPLTEQQRVACRARGISQEIVDFLSTPGTHGNVEVDPRVYVIHEWGWIRTKGNAFYAWRWDRATKLMLLNARDYWDEQKGHDPNPYLDLHEISTGEESSCTLDALKHDWKKCLNGLSRDTETLVLQK